MSLVIPTFYCIFNADGSLTHDSYELPSEVTTVPLNTYAICLAESKGHSRKVVAGLLVLTSHDHDDPAFALAMHDLVAILPELAPHLAATTSLLPAKLGLPPGGAPLTERECLRIMVTQYTKFSSGGHA